MEPKALKNGVNLKVIFILRNSFVIKESLFNSKDFCIFVNKLRFKAMAFKQFTTPKKVKDYFKNVVLTNQNFIPDKIDKFSYPDLLEKEIDFALKTYKSNESFADKFLIAPLLKYVWQNHDALNLWSQPFIKINSVLQGRPDYLISALDKMQYELLSIPIVILVEAKHENFTSGWGQCLAEMLACQQLNTNLETIIYGIVSTGKSWEFGKLEGNIFIKNVKDYSISNLQQTINIVNYIFDLAEKEIPKMDTSVTLDTFENESEDLENEEKNAF